MVIAQLFLKMCCTMTCSDIFVRFKVKLQINYCTFLSNCTFDVGFVLSAEVKLPCSVPEVG